MTLACDWLVRAADNHNVKTCALLYKEYKFGSYLTWDGFFDQIEVLLSYAEKGDAVFVSGCMHFYDFYGTRDYEEEEEKGLELLKKSAEKYDNEFAQLQLMDVYFGICDYKESYYWASKAAKHGSAKALCKQVFLKARFQNKLSL